MGNTITLLLRFLFVLKLFTRKKFLNWVSLNANAVAITPSTIIHIWSRCRLAFSSYSAKIRHVLRGILDNEFCTLIGEEVITITLFSYHSINMYFVCLCAKSKIDKFGYFLIIHYSILKLHYSNPV